MRPKYCTKNAICKVSDQFTITNSGDDCCFKNQVSKQSSFLFCLRPFVGIGGKCTHQRPCVATGFAVSDNGLVDLDHRNDFFIRTGDKHFFGGIKLT